MADLKNSLVSGDEFGFSQAILDWNVTLHFRHEPDYIKNAARKVTEADPTYDLNEFLSQPD